MKQNKQLCSFKRYKKALFEEHTYMAKNTNIRKSNKFGTPKMYTIDQTKIGIDCSDDKRLWITLLNSVPYGYQEKLKEKPKKPIEERLISNLHTRIQPKLLALPKELHIRFDREIFDEYLGCSIELLKSIVEQQFPHVDIPVCWQNYGKLWELDHIIPVSLLDVEQLQILPRKQY